MATRAAKFGRFTYTNALEFGLTANIFSFLVKIGDRVLMRTDSREHVAISKFSQH